VHHAATQFFEFAGMSTDPADPTGAVRLPTASIQPIASSEVARIVAEVAVGEPKNGHLDIAGPQRFGLDEFIRLAVPDANVVTDAEAGYSGAKLQQESLVPAGPAILSEITLADWQATRWGSRWPAEQSAG
jgi:uncharacterized protein YbjT (DUF2867 family)